MRFIRGLFILARASPCHILIIMRNRKELTIDEHSVIEKTEEIYENI